MGTRLKRILKVAALEAVAKKVSYRVKVSLVGAAPPVWRRFEITGDYYLADLHGMIQDTMGWHDSEYHAFRIDGESFMDPEQVDDEDPKIFDENLMLSALHFKAGQKFEYIYDFDSDWVHEIEIEAVRQIVEVEEDRPVLDGEGACPPEGCGGMENYAALLTAYGDKKRKDHAEAIEWFGEDFEPEVWEDKEAWCHEQSAAAG